MQMHPVAGCIIDVELFPRLFGGLDEAEKVEVVLPDQAFVDQGAFQCGFCTPGMLIAAHALLRANPRPTREQSVAHMDRQLCRCGAHQRIVDAVEDASRRLGARP